MVWTPFLPTNSGACRSDIAQELTEDLSEYRLIRAKYLENTGWFV